MQIHTKTLNGPNIVSLSFDDAKLKEDFLLKAKSGNIDKIMPFFDIKTIPYENIHKKNTDFINIEEVSSDLSVHDYLLFFSMILRNNNDIAIDSIYDIITLYKGNHILSCDINSLGMIDKLFIRTIISYIKKSKFIIIDHGLPSMEQCSFLFDFFDRYLISRSSYCIFMDIAI